TEADRAEERRLARHVVDEPAERDLLNPNAEVGDERAGPEEAVVAGSEDAQYAPDLITPADRGSSPVVDSGGAREVPPPLMDLDVAPDQRSCGQVGDVPAAFQNRDAERIRAGHGLRSRLAAVVCLNVTACP